MNATIPSTRNNAISMRTIGISSPFLSYSYYTIFMKSLLLLLLAFSKERLMSPTILPKAPTIELINAISLKIKPTFENRWILPKLSISYSLFH